jgi:putative mRNA 3-end processing factor
MRFFEDSGLVVSNGCNIAIDCARPKNAGLAVITHAHSDHLPSGKFEGKILASRETVELLNGRVKGGKIIAKNFSEKHEFENFGISLESSCHILGSSQVILEGEKKVVVTSDFQLQESLMLPKAEIHNADILVIESTFGIPSYSFPERQETYREIAKWVENNSKEGKFSVLAGYALGKSQELCKVLSEYSSEVPVVHERVFEFNKIYENLGVKLGSFESLNNNLRDFNVAILPPSLVSREFLQALSLSLERKVSAGIATGWGFKSACFEKTFPLSDHADFRQLMHYVQESGARQVFTMHGFAKEFARHLKRKMGINAMPLNAKGQKSLQEFFD